jgi:hypothetical protein
MMRSITQGTAWAQAIGRRRTLLLAPIALLTLSAFRCDDDDPCAYQWAISGDTGISVERAPRVGVKICLDERCAEGVLDTTGLVGDRVAIETELEGPFRPTFRLSHLPSQTDSTWHYEVVFWVGFLLVRHSMSVEARDDVSGVLLFRARYEATKMDVEIANQANVCRPEHAIVDINPGSVANP